MVAAADLGLSSPAEPGFERWVGFGIGNSSIEHDTM